MKRGFRLGLLGAAAFLVALTVVPFLLPASVYKRPIEESATRATGRAFTIAGPLRFTLFPMLGIRVDRIALANVIGGRAPAMATADDARLGVKWWPLLSGHIEITQIVLDGPVINLEVDKERHANWTFDHAPRTESNTPGSSVAVRFSIVEILHGRVIYSNLHTGAARAVDDLNAKLTFTGLDQPASIDGAFRFLDQRVSFHANATTPRSLLQGRTAAIDVSLASGMLRGAFSGTVALDGGVNGNLQIEMPSVRQAATWLGAHLPDSGGFGALSLESHVQGDCRRADFTGLKLKLDGTSASGDIALDTSGDVPVVKGVLAADHIDLNPYIERSRKPGAPHEHHDEERWSAKPITLDILKKADADLALTVGSLTIRKLNLDRARIAVALHSARLKARLDPVALYGGSGKAVLDVDARVTPTFHDNVEFDNVVLQPFLSDTIGVRQIEGVGTIKLDVTSSGATTEAIMHRIGGRGSIAFRDGRLRGVNFGAVAKTVQSLLGTAINPDTFTAYSAITASFAATNGVLTSNDFSLAGPVLNTTGSGTVDVGNRAIDFRIEPHATATIAKQNFSIDVPFHIKGPWKHVHYVADIASMANSVMKNLEAGQAPFKGLFGSSQLKDPDAPKKKHKNVGDALKNMLGIH